MPPSLSWRLNQAASKARRAESLARTANKILAEAQVNVKIPTESFESLHRVASEVLEARNRRVA